MTLDSSPNTSTVTLKLQLADGSLQLPITGAIARELQAQLEQLIQNLGAKKATLAKLPPWEYQHRGTVFIEVFCNPNLWANPFVAKVLVTVRHDQLRCSLEMPLTQLRQDLQDCVGDSQDFLP